MKNLALQVRLVLGLTVLLASAASSEADVILRKRVIAHFPDRSWCPFKNQYEFLFLATDNKADVIFEALPGELLGQVEIGNVSLVEESVFANGFRASNDLEEEGCWQEGVPYFKSSDTSANGIFYLPLASDAGWSLSNAEISDSSLFMDAAENSPSVARVTVTGLTPGKRYFVTGWSGWTDSGEVTVQVDTPRPPALFLQNGRFKLELRFEGSQLPGGEVISERSAVFWFRDSRKAELIVNVNDRCQDKGTFHVQVGGTTATQMSIVITDLKNGSRLSYQNRAGERIKTKLDQKTFRCN